jgi:hypothetical protein
VPASGTRSLNVRIMAVVQWFPAVAAVAYGVLLLFRIGPVLRAVYSNSDAASPSVIAQCVGTRFCGGGRVTLGHIGYFTTLWFDLLTRSFPAHRIVWEAGPYALSLAAGLILGWTVYRLAGAWAGATAVAIATAASSATLYANVAQAFHGTTWFATVVLGAWLASQAAARSWRRWRTLAVVVGLGAFAGANLASDPLLAVTGVAPLVLCPAVLWLRSGRRRYGALTAIGTATAAVAVAFSLATELAMRSAGFAVAPMSSSWSASGLDQVAGRALTLLNDIGALAGIGPIGGAAGGHLALHLLALAPVLAAISFTLARSVARQTPHDDEPRAVHLTYWGISAQLLLLVFLLSGVPLGPGTPSSRYLVGLTYACAAVLPVVMCRSDGTRVAVAAAAATFAAVSCASLAAGELPALKAPLAIVRFGPAIVRTLEALGIRRGYAQYWKAAPLTSESSGRVLVAPVNPCDNRRALCPYRLNSISAWYAPRRTKRSFLLTEPSTDGLGLAARSLGTPRATKRFGPLQLLIYEGDISTRLVNRQ